MTTKSNTGTYIGHINDTNSCKVFFSASLKFDVSAIFRFLLHIWLLIVEYFWVVCTCMYKMRAKRARSFKSMGQKTGQLRLICTSQRELNWPEERLTVMLSVDCRATSSYLHDNLALCLLINHVSYLKCGSYHDLWHILWQLFWKNCTTHYMIYT